MGECISREAIIKELEEEIDRISEPDNRDALINMGIKIALRDIKRLPATDIHLAKYGRWENEHLEDDVWWADCTNCKNETHSKFGRVSSYVFCPNCGARMDGETSNE